MKAVLRKERGQSIVETILMIPLLLLLLLNALNFGYFFLVTLNLTGATRTGMLYGILGSSTPAGTALPAPAGTSKLTASYLTYKDLTGALNSPGNAQIQVCSPAIGVIGTGTSQTAKCQTCTNSTSCGAAGAGTPAPDADPEAPSFLLNRLDITYTFVPLIPGKPFNIFMLANPACNAAGTSCTFHRFVVMRAMGS
jgi:hypothetical protein